MNNSPTLRQLEYLVALADAGQFRRAAELVAVSQPALSRQVKDVEEQLGCVLFDRSSRGVRPTPEGEVLIGHAREVLRRAGRLVRAAEALRDPFRGPLRLGVIPTLAPFLLPSLLPAMRGELPSLQLRVHEAQTEDLASRLREGALDVALVALPYPDRGLLAVPLYADPFVLVVPRGHPLDAEGPLPVAALGEHALVSMSHGHCLREHALHACGRREGKPPPLAEVESLATLGALVLSGVGPALLPGMALPSAFDPVALRRVRVRRFIAPAPARQVGLWFRPASARRPLFDRLAALLARLPPAPEGAAVGVVGRA